MNYCSDALFSKIAYRKMGSGPVLLLIHGFPADGNLWRIISPALMGHCTLLIPDLPGTGESIWNDQDVTIERLADEMITIADHEGAEKIIVAGHSMGGYIAIAMAKKYPQRIAGLCMIHSTAAADDEPKKEVRRRAIELIQKGGRDLFIRQTVPNLFAAEAKTKQPRLIEQQIEDGLKVSVNSLTAFYTAMMRRPDNRDILKNVPFPVQWIIGENDTIIPPQTVMQQSYSACVNFVSVYKECGHMSMLENPAFLIVDLLDFMDYCHH